MTKTPPKAAPTPSAASPRPPAAAPSARPKVKAVKTAVSAAPTASKAAPASALPANAGKQPSKRPVAPAAAAHKRSKVQAKPPKPALVRDSFTMPGADFALIAALKARALTAQRAAKKSELLRAGLRALDTLPPEALVEALEQLQPVKVGRPKKKH